MTKANPEAAALSPQGGGEAEIVAKSAGDFGFDLYRDLSRANHDDSLFFSPYSLSIVLTMAAAGARDTTAREMAKALRLPAASADGLQPIHTGYQQLQASFAASTESPEQLALQAKIRDLKTRLAPHSERIRKLEDGGTMYEAYEAVQAEEVLVAQINKLLGQVQGHRLSIANGIYCDNSYPLESSFVEALKSNYSTGAVVAADFRANPGAAINSINSWVRNRTEQRIRQIVGPESIDDQTRMVLLNAVHFQAQWLRPFPKDSTESRPFHLANGTTRDVMMMQSYGQMRGYGAFTAEGALFDTPATVRADPGPEDEAVKTYPENGFHMVELAYRGGDLAMVLLAPIKPDGLPVIEAKLSSTALNDWLSKLARRKTAVSMPKFTTENAYSVRDSLERMGMRAAFDRSQADFRGMTASDSSESSPYISAVVHKSFISVDEEGTEAVAASMLGMRATAARLDRIPFTPHFDADRPFVYMIRDVRTGVVLFLGRYVKP